MQTKNPGARVEIQEFEHQIRTSSDSHTSVAVKVHNPRSILGQETLVAFMAVDYLQKSRQEPRIDCTVGRIGH